ncbi:unnamed protein product [Effrenium voratum]|uniref:Uncharacterized protein n=1 Tax=Effrenium voratum TaxID=2562239 RepID=A0AA36HPR2_9DINO|nr:unnamed protein product [Effrenium voratum]
MSFIAEAASAWKSVRHGKVPWTEEQVEQLAVEQMKLIPERACRLIRDESFRGGDLVYLPNALARPTYKELSRNYVWVRIWASQFPEKAPSVFLIADVLQRLDQKFAGNLLQHTDKCRAERAGEEAGRIRKLLSALRYLFRNGTGSPDPKVAELKGLLRPSPSSKARRMSKGSSLGDADTSASAEDSAELTDEDAADGNEGALDGCGGLAPASSDEENSDEESESGDEEGGEEVRGEKSGDEEGGEEARGEKSGDEEGGEDVRGEKSGDEEGGEEVRGEKSGDEVSGGEEVSDGKEVRGEEAEDDGEAALASSQDSEKTLRLGQGDSPRAVVAISPSTPCNETQLPSPDQPLLDQTAPDHADTNELLKVSNGYCSDEDGSEENAPMETQYVLVPKPALERKRSCVDVVAESEQAAKRSRQEEVDTAYDCAKPRVKKADPGRSRAPGKATKKGKKQNPPRATFKRGHTKKVKAVKGGADAAPGSSDADQEVVAILVSLLFAKPLVFTPLLDHVELFAGQMSVSIGEMEENRCAVALDLEMGKSGEMGEDAYNMLHPIGFAHSLFQVCRLKPGRSGLLAAPVCSTWVYMSRGSTGRSLGNPGGDPRFPATNSGNVLCSRTLVLLWIAAALQCWWVLEQPQGSLMEHYAPFQAFLKRVRAWRHRMKMLDYGGPSAKPTWLYSSRKEIEHLEQFAPRHLPAVDRDREPCEMVIHYKDTKGIDRIKGGKDLKKSQAYPRLFGRSLAKLRTSQRASQQSEARKIRKRWLKQGPGSLNSKDSARWIKWADLDGVMQFLV